MSPLPNPASALDLPCSSLPPPERHLWRVWPGQPPVRTLLRHGQEGVQCHEGARIGRHSEHRLRCSLCSWLLARQEETCLAVAAVSTITCQPAQPLVSSHPVAHPPLLSQTLGATELLHRGEGDDDRDIDEDFDKWCAHILGLCRSLLLAAGTWVAVSGCAVAAAAAAASSCGIGDLMPHCLPAQSFHLSQVRRAVPCAGRLLPGAEGRGAAGELCCWVACAASPCQMVEAAAPCQQGCLAVAAPPAPTPNQICTT